MIFEFLADGFEEIEALCPIDVIRRAGLEIKTVAVGGKNDKKITGSHGICVNAELSLSDAVLLSEKEKIDMIILPGGMPGAKNLDENPIVESFLNRAYTDGAYIASICAAPMIPGKRGMLRGRRAVCYPGFEEYLLGAQLSEKKVAVDGRIITAKAAGCAVDFGLTLLQHLKGLDEANRVKDSIYY